MTTATLTIEQHIEIQARESAAALRGQGWTGDGRDYALEAYHGDREALIERLGGAASSWELKTLEQAIREELTASHIIAESDGGIPMPGLGDTNDAHYMGRRS